MATSKRVDLRLVYQELQQINKTITEHTLQDNRNFEELKESLEGNASAPGLKMRVDRIEQLVKHVRFLWGAVIAIVGLLLAYRH